MKFYSSVVYIVVEPATDCCRYVGVEDTIEQMLMVHIVECNRQIERDEHCSVSRLFFLRSRQQCQRWSSRVQCMSSASAENHVEQGGKGYVPASLAAGAFPAF